ncbi:MAG: amidohydrolase family protein [Opitutae bacterium]|nr:amidohydrolase family protein [Opitutae bacterium]
MKNSAVFAARAARCVALFAFAWPAVAAVAESTPAAASKAILIRNARVFDGKGDALIDGLSVLVVGDKIAKVSKDAVAPPEGALVIDARGRTLTPGFVDVHMHASAFLPGSVADHASPWQMGVYMAKSLEGFLQRGFTTVRDAGGADGSIAELIDQGYIAGPRLFPSGPALSQTGGHGDRRAPYAAHPYFGRAQELAMSRGLSWLVDGPDEVLRAARENLKNGATQIKILASGGVLSQFDPLHTVQFTPEEIRAAVAAASNWGTYVMAHAYNVKAVRQLLDNGVLQIMHGHLLDEATIKLAAEKGAVIEFELVWQWSDDVHGKANGLSDVNLAKLHQIKEGMTGYLANLKKYHVLTGFGTDLVGNQEFENKEFTLRAEYFTPAEVLRQATSEGYAIISRCGPLNKYGKFGTIEEGNQADILLINGDPLKDISLLEQPETALALIMRDGKIFKNTTGR